MSNEYQVFGAGVEYFGAASGARFYATAIEVYLVPGLTINPAFLANQSAVFAPRLARDIAPQSLEASNTRELIPYASQIPEALRDISPELHEFLGETMVALREQHSLAQTGGTTYPWELLLKQDATQLYRLGTVGRFYHPDYGIIQARYVRLNETVPVGDWLGQAVGYSGKRDSLDWTVTNDFTKSSSRKIVGFLATNQALVDGQYTWVITEGVNIHSMRLADTTLLEQGDGVVWSGTGLVSKVEAGIVAARLWKGKATADLRPGIMLVKIESESAVGLVAPVKAAVEAVDLRVNTLESARVVTDRVLANLDAGIEAVAGDLDAAEAAIDAEVDARRRTVQQLKRDLRDLESRITQAYRLADTALRSEFRSADSAIRALFQSALNEIDVLERQIGTNYTALNDSIKGLRRRIEGLEAIYGVQLPFRLAYTYNGVMLTGQIVDSYVFNADVLIPQNAPTSQLRCKTGPSVTTVIELKRGASVLGEIQFTAGATTGTITWPADITFTAGQVLDIVTPANLNGLQSLFFSLIGSFIR